MKLTKKMTKGLILSASAALAFGAVAAGTTYALFTSNAENSVSVSSGKISLKSEILNLKLYSLSEETGEIVPLESEDTFTLGGTATIDGTTLKLDKVVPGDKVEFEIKVTNESNVDIKFREVFKTVKDTGLGSGLEYTIDEETYDGGTIITDYELWEAKAAEQEKTVKVSIALPKSAENIYQEKSCELSFNFEAIQKNAKTEDVDSTVYQIYTPTDLSAFANKVSAGTFTCDKVILMDDIDMDGLSYMSPMYARENTAIEFDGNGKTIKNLVALENSDKSGNRGAGLFGKVGHGSLNIHNLNMENVTVSGSFTVEGDQHLGGGAIVGTSDSGVSAIDITNVSVTGVSVKGVKYAGGIVGYSSIGGTDTIKNVTVKDAEISGYTAGGVIGQVGGGKAVINGVEGSGIVVDGYKREGGMVGANSGTSLTITYDEAEYSSSISGEAFGNRGTIVGLTGDTTVNGNQYHTAISTDQVKGIKAASDKLNIVEIFEGTYSFGGATNLQSVKGGVEVRGIGDKTKIKWMQAGGTDVGYGFSGTNLTMKNVSVGTEVTGNYLGFPGAASVSFEDCVFNVTKANESFRYWGDGAVNFKNCKFDSTKAEDSNMFTYGGKSFYFEGCEFISDEAAIKLYRNASLTDSVEVPVTITGCTFKNVHEGTWSDSDLPKRTVLSIDTDNAADKTHYKVTMTNSSYSGNYSDGILADRKGLFGVRQQDKVKKSLITFTLDGTTLDLGLPE